MNVRGPVALELAMRTGAHIRAVSRVADVADAYTDPFRRGLNAVTLGGMRTKRTSGAQSEEPRAQTVRPATNGDVGATPARVTVAAREGTSSADSETLERLLDALEQQRLTPLDVRIMLRVNDDETTIADVAGSVGLPTSTIRRASRRLVMRGLLRRRRRRDRPLTFTLTATDSGASALHRIRRSLAGRAAMSEQLGPTGAGRRVVVGYDGSDAARRALERGAAAAGPDGTLTVVSVRPSPPDTGLTPEPFAEAADDPADLLAEARATLVRARTIEVRTVAAEGNPPIEIVDVARSVDADLIVVGRTGGRFMSRAIFGPVAVRVVELSSCDVLVVA
jgi:nucleotide-binding universal stress UspA family protein